MRYLGIDVHVNTSVWCLLDATGKLVERGKTYVIDAAPLTAPKPTGNPVPEIIDGTITTLFAEGTDLMFQLTGSSHAWFPAQPVQT